MPPPPGGGGMPPPMGGGFGEPSAPAAPGGGPAVVAARPVAPQVEPVYDQWGAPEWLATYPVERPGSDMDFYSSALGDGYSANFYEGPLGLETSRFYDPMQDVQRTTAPRRAAARPKTNFGNNNVVRKAY